MLAAGHWLSPPTCASARCARFNRRRPAMVRSQPSDARDAVDVVQAQVRPSAVAVPGGVAVDLAPSAGDLIKTVDRRVAPRRDAGLRGAMEDQQPVYRSGDGELTAVLVAHGFDVAAVEPDPRMRAVLRPTRPPASLPGFESTSVAPRVAQGRAHRAGSHLECRRHPTRLRPTASAQRRHAHGQDRPRTVIARRRRTAPCMPDLRILTSRARPGHGSLKSGALAPLHIHRKAGHARRPLRHDDQAPWPHASHVKGPHPPFTPPESATTQRSRRFAVDLLCPGLVFVSCVHRELRLLGLPPPLPDVSAAPDNLWPGGQRRLPPRLAELGVAVPAKPPPRALARPSYRSAPHPHGQRVMNQRRGVASVLENACPDMAPRVRKVNRPQWPPPPRPPPLPHLQRRRERPVCALTHWGSRSCWRSRWRSYRRQ